MRKIFVSFITAAAIAAPFAHASGTPITVEFTYDGSLLETEAGARTVLESIERQADKACSYRVPAVGTIRTDRTCRQDLIEKAIIQIRQEAAEEGVVASLVFADASSENIAQ